nr:hypothetical protein Q903MT_gene410 [Picea sitchensis]
MYTPDDVDLSIIVLGRNSPYLWQVDTIIIHTHVLWFRATDYPSSHG